MCRQVHVVYGVTEAGCEKGIVYNSAVLTGPTGHIGTFRKVHLGVTERALWCAGSDWPVFDTAAGRIGLLICYDKMWPEACRELTLRGAEVLVMPTAWGLMPGHGEGADNLSVRLYDLYDRVRAAENCRWFVSANLAGELGGHAFFGMSQVVNPMGDVVATTGMDRPGLTFASVDIQGGLEAARAATHGAFLIRDRRPETYECLRGVRSIEIEG
jgi:predicted amidohydrolase